MLGLSRTGASSEWPALQYTALLKMWALSIAQMNPQNLMYMLHHFPAVLFASST